MLHRPLVDARVEPDQLGQIQQTLFLAGHRGAAGTGRHEQRFDAERVSGAKQFAGNGVPQREGEHAAQSGQDIGAPVVVAGDDGLAVTIGGEDGPMGGGQFVAQLQVVVDLAVEHQHVAVGRLRRPQRSGWCECAMSMMDSRLKPNTTEPSVSGSTQVPGSSGPRWRIECDARAIASSARAAAASLSPSSGRQRTPADHTRRPSMPHLATARGRRTRHGARLAGRGFVARLRRVVYAA